MLKIIRLLLVAIFAILICFVGTIYALIRLRHPSSVGVVAHMFGRLHHLFGINVIRRVKPLLDQPVIYIANHQNNYDMVTIAAMVPPNTVSIGKKSLVWIPFFGMVYWATGNILINRESRSSAIATMNRVAEIINSRKVSIWMFPEGTRSRGRGMLPFKSGAFHTAIAAGVPIVPIVCSSLHNKVDLNRWNNGTVICEVLDPIDTREYSRETVKALIEKCQTLMQAKLLELDQEIAAQEK